MPAWLRRLFGRKGRISKLYDPERFTRKDFLIIVFCIAVIAIISLKIYDIFGLSIVAGIVAAIIILSYLPRMSLLIIGLAGCAFLFREASGIKHWQTLVPLVAMGFIALCGLVYEDDHLILQQLDSLHEKIDRLLERIEEIESKLDD
jgi:hypothetical protein